MIVYKTPSGGEDVCIQLKVYTLSHNLIENKLVDLIERIFHKESSACNDRNAFFTSDAARNYIYNL